ncbi:hypothetical protein PV733_41200 [Streptomyces europaeiscabiei]|uniref:hypothetical protein n=1 Tax=Streptomyces europaeiscabiei TaxID=146819 RepID=UPI0029BA7AE9|nr:hypothetical protein [Streptomyces europaeiscabiei]MDX2760960.1 hypothetical protein [Streptomyces europaeiscabiei]MDX3715237.1 hypothetical protein [Streptomyces europaeiscabiei]MDX3779590.1 hypothetical protein [Streptomyces europaeiscabiei]
MGDEKDGGNGSIRRRSWGPVLSSEPVVTTVLLELAGLAVYGVVTLVGWLFGSAPDPHLAAFTATVAAAGPAIDLYREGRPPRRLAVVAALLTLAGLSLLGAAATSWALPPAADPGLGLLVGYLVAMPAGVAVLARFLGGEEPT